MTGKIKLASVIFASMITIACGGGGGGGSTPPADGGSTPPTGGGSTPPTDGGSNPPAPVTEKLFFSATGDVNQGAELWATDGTESGTALVKDINPAGDSSPHHVTRVGNEWFFVATTADNGKELWKTNGTEDGTVLVKDIHPSGDANPTLLTALDDKLVFVASDDTDRAIWVSDGTADGTVRVTNGSTGVNPGTPTEMVVFNNKVYFAAGAESTATLELWSTDGTTAGTALHRVNQNRLPSAGLPAGTITPYVGASIQQMVANDTSLFFIGNNDVIGSNFAALRIDTSNTVQRLGTDPGIGELTLVSFAANNTGVAYSYNFGGGDIAGFYDKNDFARRAVTVFGQNTAKPAELTAFGDKLLFTLANNDVWITTSFFNGTTRVKDNLSDIRDMNTLGNKAVLIAKENVTIPGLGIVQSDEQLWVTDGTTNNTIKINDQVTNDSMGQFTEFDGKLYFTAATAANGQELWVTDGTFAGTRMLKDINDGATASNPLLVGVPAAPQ